MHLITRREVLRSSGAAAALLALGTAACSGSKSGNGRSSRANRLVWWDHYIPLQDLHRKIFADFEQKTGIKVEYTVRGGPGQGPALQLAHSSKQMPDVLTLAGIDTASNQLQRRAGLLPSSGIKTRSSDG